MLLTLNKGTSSPTTLEDRLLSACRASQDLKQPMGKRASFAHRDPAREHDAEHA